MNSVYEDRVEIFAKDIYQLYRFDFMDKQDKGNRVQQLLKGIPTKSWEEDPSLTVVGALPKSNFCFYINESIALGSSNFNFGRMQIFALMKPEDYVVGDLY